jgi:hypothetical protein
VVVPLALRRSGAIEIEREKKRGTSYCALKYDSAVVKKLPDALLHNNQDSMLVGQVGGLGSATAPQA